MALKIIDGSVDEVGPETVSETGTSWEFVRFSRGRKRPLTLANVMADPKVGARIRKGQLGRFAFYTHDSNFILCGFAGSHGIEIVGLEDDPAAKAAAAIRTPAKRKVLLGFVMLPTIIGLFFGPDMIKEGYAILRANPPPRRPGNKRLTRALKGHIYWPF